MNKEVAELNPLLPFTTANGVNGGPDISFLRAEREVVGLFHRIFVFWLIFHP